MRTRVVRSEERTDNELAPLDRSHVRAYLLNNTAVLMAHRRRSVHLIQTAIRPQVRSAYAGHRQADDRVGRLDNARSRAFVEPYIPRTVKNCSSQYFPFSLFFLLPLTRS